MEFPNSFKFKKKHYTIWQVMMEEISGSGIFPILCDFWFMNFFYFV